ncbi:hypothetical protein [Acinetobacter sp.]|uniref:hypothetical protein n=1 Tax=Acinetobacter sp. TaxID=472 RepID=UPI003890E130
MEFLGFALSVWAALILGVFIIAMIIGVTFDRHGAESPKWWIFVIGLITFAVWYWKNSPNGFEWHGIVTAFMSILVPVLIYLAIGLAYSVLEFMLEVRRSARKWADLWKSYKASHRDDFTKSPETAANSFVSHNSRSYDRLIVVDRNPDEKSANYVVPRVNRGRLASFIGAWTFFWPFYAISLIIGDLFAEIFRIIANFFVHMSGRFVRVMFKDVFN